MGRGSRDCGEAQQSNEPFDVQAVNPRYKGAWMSDVALALMRPKNAKVAAIIEARRDDREEI
ncbi:MAG: hypothetical protein OXR82_18085 [Gammaproteobacteria bacterium]|nr:hypothetical protein [Gammaproteobacteria bacterium]